MTPAEVLEFVAKARAMIKRMKASGEPEPYLTLGNQVVFLFDPETDALLGELERAALRCINPRG